MSDATSPGVPPPPPPPGAGSAPSSDKTAMLVLSYLGLLALVPLLVEKEDKNVLWHAKNGLVIFAAFFIALIVLWIVSMVVGFVPGLGCLFSVVSFFAGAGIWIGYLVVIIIAIMKAVKGERLIVPGVSEYANRF
jgi:uncharacterized membrane protein